MSQQIAEKFINALGDLESSRDVDTIAGLFAEDAALGNVVSVHNFRGEEGAREFWTVYRDSFGEVESTFRNIVITDGTVALEWNTKGTNGDGGEIDYNGVSVMEVENGRIGRFYAYFDPAKLGKQIANHGG
jgi:limonene-1,2-epoxide hydrolase